MRLSTTLAILGATAAAAAQPHRHQHRHAHHAHPVEKRADATEVVAGPVVTVYELNGIELAPGVVEEGMRKGIYIQLPDSSTPAASVPTAVNKAGEFFERPASSSTPPPAPTPEPKPTPTPTPEPPKQEPPKSEPPKAKPSKAASASGGGVTADFPSGEIDCSTFPSAYGAVAADWLKMSGWIGIQKTPGYAPGASSISEIHTGIAGDSCQPGSFCSYACPAGYQKAQWPTAQGSTGQSIGGIYCNSQGKLELTNPDLSKKLCITGTGEVKVQNKLGVNVPICRTDYPGTESETVALDTQPGTISELTCPDANNYYRWGGAFTSAQYYINPAGSPVSDACRWNEAGSNMGNWAPVNLGVGKGPGGMTYISMFQNAPTNPDGKLDYNIEITGDVSGKCEYKGGQFYNNGVVSPSGCTVCQIPLTNSKTFLT
jgi:hypothetical protein